MKQLLTILLAIAFLTAGAYQLHAQETSSNPISIGFEGGLSIANATLSPDVAAPASKSSRTGLVAGGLAEFGVASGFFISAEVLYLQGGVKVTDPNGNALGFVGDATLKFDFISIPISAKYKFPIEGSTVKPFIFGGANVGFNMKAEAEATSGGQTFTVDIKNSTESVDFGLQVGGGIEFEASHGINVVLGGRYQLGLKDLDKSAGSEAKSQNILITAGLSFQVN